jgi:hypothetical protein
MPYRLPDMTPQDQARAILAALAREREGVEQRMRRADAEGDVRGRITCAGRLEGIDAEIERLEKVAGG